VTLKKKKNLEHSR